MTTNQSNECPTADIVSQLRKTLYSQAYATRLQTIHQHYHNSKSEGRYRDALLEEFNDSPTASRHQLRAYAEADKVDMVVTRPGMRRDGWVRVELKYQFVYDLACRVSATLNSMKNDASDRTVLQQLHSLPNFDLKRIALDCIGHESDDPSELCDVFVMIVQDRSGATHPDAIRSKNGHTRRTTWQCPQLDERGVKLQFLHEQISLDAQHDPASYDQAWIEPTWDMLKLIHDLRPFNLQVAARKMADSSGPFPLTSYLFSLDFTSPAPFPGNGLEFVKKNETGGLG
jgi:DNA-binding transcriptional ArsR family regulator